MYSASFWASSVGASTEMFTVETTPNWLGSPAEPASGPTSPLFSARNAGFFLHSLHDGLVSARRPAMPSSKNGDQNIIAARPEKYVPRVESTSCAPSTE
jgi:hypothetical protein